MTKAKSHKGNRIASKHAGLYYVALDTPDCFMLDVYCGDIHARHEGRALFHRAARINGRKLENAISVLNLQFKGRLGQLRAPTLDRNTAAWLDNLIRLLEKL